MPPEGPAILPTLRTAASFAPGTPLGVFSAMAAMRKQRCPFMGETSLMYRFALEAALDELEERAATLPSVVSDGSSRDSGDHDDATLSASGASAAGAGGSGGEATG